MCTLSFAFIENILIGKVFLKLFSFTIQPFQHNKKSAQLKLFHWNEAKLNQTENLVREGSRTNHKNNVHIYLAIFSENIINFYQFTLVKEYFHVFLTKM